MRPLMQWARVDLPQPEGPAISSFSPLCMLRFISYSVGFCWALYLKPKFSNLMMGSIFILLDAGCTQQRRLPRRRYCSAQPLSYIQ